MPWSAEFDDPIDLADGHQLHTLEHAGNYIMQLPAAEHGEARWQAAMEALILIAEGGGSTDVGADRHDECPEPPREAGMQSGSQDAALGQATVEARSVAKSRPGSPAAAYALRPRGMSIAIDRTVAARTGWRPLLWGWLASQGPPSITLQGSFATLAQNRRERR